MSSADRPRREPSASGAVPVMRGPQELEHVQERFDRGVDAARAPTELDAAAVRRPKTTWRPPPTLAPTLWLISSVFGVAAASLFSLPALRSRLTPEKAPIVYKPTPSPAPAAPPAPEPVATEETSEFDGYVLMVDSEPGGATVQVNGKEQGEVPVSVGLECSPGAPVVVELSLPGYERARHHTTCKRDALVKVFAKLKKKP